MVRMKPTGITYSQKNNPAVAPLCKPVLLIRWPNTKPRLAWWLGTNAISPMITSTPITCQPTEMLLKMASSRSAKMFMTV